MDRENELAMVRRTYAKHVLAAAGVADRRIENAFAAVAREHFLGPGPWPILRNGRYVPTPSRNPVHLYTNVLVGILPERNLNNGEPALHAILIAAAAPRPGEHVVHVGAGVGVGYYTAILRHLVGRTGRVTAIEYDPLLAVRLAANFTDARNLQVIQGDGTTAEFAAADVIYVNAGATRPAESWLDRLNHGGRLILPLTTAAGFTGRGLKAVERSGAIFRIQRDREDFVARWVSAVGIFPCHGMRDTAGEAALEAAFAKGGWERVTRLYRRGDVPEEQCWLHAPGWCLAYQ